MHRRIDKSRTFWYQKMRSSSSIYFQTKQQKQYNYNYTKINKKDGYKVEGNLSIVKQQIFQRSIEKFCTVNNGNSSRSLTIIYHKNNTPTKEIFHHKFQFQLWLPQAVGKNSVWQKRAGQTKCSQTGYKKSQNKIFLIFISKVQ